MMPIPLLTPKLPQLADRRGEAFSVERIRRGENERRSFRERRAGTRLAAALALEVDDGLHRVAAETTDLSTFGLSIRTGVTLPAHAPVLLTLKLRDGLDELLQVSGVVLGTYDNLGGIRVRFVDPPLAAVRRIHRFVTKS